MLTDIEQQIILYTKGHFERNDTIEDLKIMISEWSGTNKEFITVFNVYEHVINTFVKTVPQGRVAQFFKELFNHTVTVSVSYMIQKMCSCLTTLQIRKGEDVLIVLGEPDYKLLPKKVS